MLLCTSNVLTFTVSELFCDNYQEGDKWSVTSPPHTRNQIKVEVKVETAAGIRVLEKWKWITTDIFKHFKLLTFSYGKFSDIWRAAMVVPEDPGNLFDSWGCSLLEKALSMALSTKVYEFFYVFTHNQLYYSKRQNKMFFVTKEPQLEFESQNYVFSFK